MDKLVGAFSGVLKSSGTSLQQPPQTQTDRQYLRLPLESARKLRWFEKADVQALTKSHFREKRELLDTIAVLKKILLRNGLEEAKLDAEVAAHLKSAEELQEEHEGVASVLLASLESHVQELRFENDRLQAGIKTAHLAAAATATQASDAPDTVAPGSDALPDGKRAAVKPATRRGQSVSGPLPRRLEPLDLAEINGSTANKRLDPVTKQQLVLLEEQCGQLGRQVTELKAALAKQQQAAARRTGGNDASRAQVQDMLLELQESAREEARKASRADARATRLEGELKTLQAQHRTLAKEHSALQQQLSELQSQAETASVEAAARAAAAAVDGEKAKAAAEAREEVAALRKSLTELQTELVASQTTIAKLESELQLTQQREASAAAALAEAEVVARRCDDLAAANMQLSQRLADNKAELEMATYYKKVCAELTEAKARLQDEMLGLATLLSASEVKIADMAGRVAAADEQLVAAENRARAAEASISSEIERRCNAVLSSRALWPPQLRDEVACLESRLAKLEKGHAEAVRREEAAITSEREAREELRIKTETLAALTEESAAATASFAAQLQQLREALAESQARAAGLQDDLKAERTKSRTLEEERAAAAAGLPTSTSAGTLHNYPSHAYARQGSDGCSNGHAAGPAGSSGTNTAVMTPKWQVQNKVGGGGLYNLDAAGVGAEGGGPGAPAAAEISARGGKAPLGGVDAVYMKNVLFKFLEAHLTHKVAERDMLLPAVATLLQASQEEFTALQKILRATQPPSRQMLAVLGLGR